MESLYAGGNFSDPFANPPIYSAIALLSFFAVIFGILFKDKLEYQVALWQLNRDSQAQIRYRTPGVLLTYSLCCLFTFGFVAACLNVFGLPMALAACVGGILVLGTAGLVWWQLGSLLALLATGGSQAIDIDSYGAGAVLDPEAAAPTEGE
ncbi:sterol desaturase/sphingolipid hydroxylase (fatty acid hydroxylase superfamily) [Thermostichus sp. MS-CIW-36]